MAAAGLQWVLRLLLLSTVMRTFSGVKVKDGGDLLGYRFVRVRVHMDTDDWIIEADGAIAEYRDLVIADLSAATHLPARIFTCSLTRFKAYGPRQQHSSCTHTLRPKSKGGVDIRCHPNNPSIPYIARRFPLHTRRIVAGQLSSSLGSQDQQEADDVVLSVLTDPLL